MTEENNSQPKTGTTASPTASAPSGTTSSPSGTTSTPPGSKGSAESANPRTVRFGQKDVSLDALLGDYQRLLDQEKKYAKEIKKAVRVRRQERSLKPFQAELIQMQNHLEKTKRRMIILFDGRDAAGKGGTIRRVTRYMNEKHYRIVALGKPTEEQRTQWYFQKYVSHFPRGGEVVLFDRSWYNRAMVEKVFGFCTEEEYSNFMKGVIEFEKDLIRQGTILVKLYFSVDKEEQARRFDRRKSDPLRQWKLSEIDMQAQDRWDDFTDVKYEMLKHTNTNIAPWFVVRSNDKYQARLNAIKVILNSIDYDRRDDSLDFVPNRDIVISGARELEILEAERLAQGKPVTRY
ncbi:MAG: polyphosphate kinase 2 [Proteobacteria bacterium]|nr:MAG: polyphosphate kinase 2 [Pseudomonadota bacterium]PIE40289.1 MAG: polyphosphate kinase 2 [Gammaproteobacteria bacterium]